MSEKNLIYYIYRWMNKGFWVRRSHLMIFVLLGFLLGLSTCGVLT